MQEQPVVWISPEARRTCQLDASRYFPLETGGVFMGYWADPLTAVVTAVIDGGVDACRKSHSFEPDYGYQNARIAAHYERHGRRETYLGDWHSHPHAISGALSAADRRVIKRIAKSPAARSARPLMAIIFGEPGSWQWSIQLAWLKRGLLGLDRVQTMEAIIRPR